MRAGGRGHAVAWQRNCMRACAAGLDRGRSAGSCCVWWLTTLLSAGPRLGLHALEYHSRTSMAEGLNVHA